MKQSPLYKKLAPIYDHKCVEQEILDETNSTREELDTFITNYKSIEYNEENIKHYIKIYEFLLLKNNFLKYIEELNLFLEDYENVEIKYSEDNINKFVDAYSFFSLENDFLRFVVEEFRFMHVLYNNKNIVDTVRNICAKQNHLSNSKLKYISKYIDIYELNLHYNNIITDDSIINMSLLTKLNLSRNKIITGDALKNMSLMQHLVLVDKLSVMTRHIMHMTLLTYINLWGENRINRDIVKHMPFLKKLDFKQWE